MKVSARNLRNDADCDCRLWHSCPVRFCKSSKISPRFVTLERGDRIEADLGSHCLRFWIVLRGTAATCTVFKDGRRQILGIEEPGEFICSGMAGPGRSSWLEALETCLICDLDLSTSAVELSQHTQFLTESFRLVHRRLLRSQQHMTTLGRLDSYERVLMFLAETASRQMAQHSGDPVTRLAMSREDIADYLGLNSETVSRILSRIKKSGLVKFLNKSEFVLSDTEAVARRLPMPVLHPATFRPKLSIVEATE